MIKNPVYQYFVEKFKSMIDSKRTDIIEKTVCRDHAYNGLLIIRFTKAIKRFPHVTIEGHELELSESHVSIYEQYDPQYTHLSAYHHTLYFKANKNYYTLHIYFDQSGNMISENARKLISQQDPSVSLCTVREKTMLEIMHKYVSESQRLLIGAREHVQEDIDRRYLDLQNDFNIVYKDVCDDHQLPIAWSKKISALTRIVTELNSIKQHEMLFSNAKSSFNYEHSSTSEESMARKSGSVTHDERFFSNMLRRMKLEQQKHAMQEQTTDLTSYALMHVHRQPSNDAATTGMDQRQTHETSTHSKSNASSLVDHAHGSEHEFRKNLDVLDFDFNSNLCHDDLIELDSRVARLIARSDEVHTPLLIRSSRLQHMVRQKLHHSAIAYFEKMCNDFTHRLQATNIDNACRGINDKQMIAHARYLTTTLPLNQIAVVFQALLAAKKLEALPEMLRYIPVQSAQKLPFLIGDVVGKKHTLLEASVLLKCPEGLKLLVQHGQSIVLGFDANSDGVFSQLSLSDHLDCEVALMQCHEGTKHEAYTHLMEIRQVQMAKGINQDSEYWYYINEIKKLYNFFKGMSRQNLFPLVMKHIVRGGITKHFGPIRTFSESQHSKLFYAMGSVLEKTRMLLEQLVKNRGKVHGVLIKSLFLTSSIEKSVEGKKLLDAIASLDKESQIEFMTKMITVYVDSIDLYSRAILVGATMSDEILQFPQNRKKEKKNFLQEQRKLQETLIEIVENAMSRIISHSFSMFCKELESKFKELSTFEQSEEKLVESVMIEECKNIAERHGLMSK